MKNILIIFICLTGLLLSAEWIQLTETDDQQLFDHSSGDLSEITINFNLDGYNSEQLQENGSEYLKISHSQGGDLLDFGKPDLPVFSKLIAIPDKGEVSLQILNYEEISIPVQPIYPRQQLQSESSREDIEFFIDNNFYRSSALFPEDPVIISDPAVMRDHRVVNITVQPFQYNTENNTLRIITSMQLSVNSSGEEGINQKIGNTKKSRAFEPIYKASILNYDQLVVRDEEYQQPSYLFIYADDQLLDCHPGPYDLQGIMDWKHQKGFIVNSVSVDVIGNSETTIYNYIQNAYTSWENPPEYVCLVGDPSSLFDVACGFGGSYTGATDFEYTLLEGNDDYPELSIGRLSVDSENDMEVIASKIMNYEITPYTGSTEWFKDVLLIGDTAHGTGYSAIGTCLYVKEVIENNTNSYTFNEYYSGGFSSGFESSMNGGIGYFNYRGWMGMSGIDGFNMNTLSNGFMLPFVVCITCNTGSYNYESVTEDLLEAGTALVPRGAVAVIGTATTGTHTCFNNIVSGGIYDGIFNNQIYNPGNALIHGKLSLINNYPTGPYSYVEDFLLWNNLMGDPSLELWTDIPQTFVVDYESQVSLGTNFIDVTVKNTGGRPLEDAWVTVLMGSDEIFATGYTDAAGEVRLEIDAQQTGTVTITATLHNFKTHQGTFSVIQDDLFLNVLEVNIDDDNSGSSSGNNNGIVNPGEDIELDVTLKNYGSGSASSVNAVLSTTAGVTISDATENYGIIPSGNSGVSTDDFDFSVPDNTLGGTQIEFDLEINASSREQWIDHIQLYVEGPNLSSNGYIVQDGNNGILDPGEISNMAVTLNNIGSTVASNITATLLCSDPGVTILDAAGAFGNINPDSQVSNTTNNFEVEIDDQVLPGTQIQCSLNIINSSGFEQLIKFSLNIGDVNVNHPTGPDEYGYYMFDDGDSQFSLAPVYSWDFIDPDFGGSGESLGFSDSGENGDIDVLSLPFDFKFYGRRYDDITVCSNGWIAFGSTEQFTFMNWQIPGALGPSPMIAPFWDDLKTSGSGQVYYYYNSADHKFIIEWSSMQNHYDNSVETFQLILFDENYYETITGDGEILIQYQTVNNIDQGSYPSNHGQYSTVGIEDHNGEAGLQYTFNNTYPPSAKPLTNNMAIFVTTNIAAVVTTPEAAFSSDLLEFSIIPGGSDDQTLDISNSGEANLVYNISKDYADSRDIDITRDSGGPDNYGYQWLDSNEPNGPEFDWIDITGVGTALVLTDDDNEVISLPFDFEFYGTSHSSVRISSNGYLTFGSTGNDYNNDGIPNLQVPNDIIAPFWDDLKPIGGNWGTVYYYSDTANNRFIVEYHQVSHWHSSTPRDHETFEVILYENGNMMFQYLIATNEDDLTAGIENQSGTDGLEIVHNNGSYLENNLAVLMKTVADWVDVSPASGFVEESGIAHINVSVDASELEVGDYLCDLIVTTNDPNASIVVIPIELLVGEIVITPPENVVISYDHGMILLSWDPVLNADSYSVFGSSSMDLSFESWDLIESGIMHNNWSASADSSIKFFKVTAVIN